MTGMRFGRVTCIEWAGTNDCGQSLWKCRCDCGVEFVAFRHNLLHGHTTSCGCYRSEKARMDNYRRFGKGLPFEQWLKESQERMYRREHRGSPGGWNRRAVVAIDSEGRQHHCESIAKAAKAVGVCDTAIGRCLKKKQHTSAGFRWFYFDDPEWVKYVKR